MTMEECPSFNTCSAPLCPLDPKIDTRVWYPSEEVCKRKWKPLAPHWLQKQRRLARRCQLLHTYFTLKMILALRWITQKTKGIDPDSDQTIEAWIKDKTAIRPPPAWRTPEQSAIQPTTTNL